jgi:4-diphosphocytidyl-2-C-methyl-D-erythritol kinase
VILKLKKTNRSYLSLLSPAKINLFFRVLKKREDGYHQIASLYQAINLFDILHIGISDIDSFTCSDRKIPTNSSNLIMKAIDVFRKKTNSKINVDIHLEKNIPIKAGLGGGSSNAATTLFALNELANTKLSISELRDLSSVIGSDVAFFFSTGLGYCTGKGEAIEDLNRSDFMFSAYLAKPRFGVSTPAVYENLNLESCDTIDPAILLKSILSGNNLFLNDLEKSACIVEPRLVVVKNRLKKMGFDQVVLTGSGSSFFCLGNVENPKLENICFYKISNISKKPTNWYTH